MSIFVSWIEFKSYVESHGPGKGLPGKPAECMFCGWGKVWFNGWRLVYVTVLLDGEPHRQPQGVPLQRVRCARHECGVSWTLRPPWCYPHRSYQPQFVEKATFEYLEGSQGYREVAARMDCSRAIVWLWVGCIAALAVPGRLLARAARMQTGAVAAGMAGAGCPAVFRARSSRRRRIVLRGAQVLRSLAILYHVQPEPPSDPSPLSWYLAGEFLAFRRKALVTGGGFSPAFEREIRPPPSQTAGHATDRRPPGQAATDRALSPRDHRRTRR